jgi:hypothetical protein
MTRGTESPRSAGKHKEAIFATVRAADAGKAAARVATIQVAHHHLLDNRPKEPVLLLEAVFILRKEPVKIKK